ncbi:MAG: S8 family serine peptidase, partial [Anaerolineae bacterium]|nr:S8 family serine peptidase [Anaerolineae bacterium]
MSDSPARASESPPAALLQLTFLLPSPIMNGREAQPNLRLSLRDTIIHLLIEKPFMRLTPHFTTRFTIGLLLVTIAFTLPVGAIVQPSEPGPSLYLQRVTFDPLREEPSFPTRLMAPASVTDEPGYAIVQFQGPIQPAWWDAATAAGAELLDYIPDYAFVARLKPGAAQALLSLPSVRWVGPFHPAYKVSFALDPVFARGSQDEKGEVLDLRVRLFIGEDLPTVERELAALGAHVTGHSANQWGSTLRLRLPASALADAARIAAISWLEPGYPRQLFNDVGRAAMGVHTAWGRISSLYGAGQIVGVADTGLDTGNTATLSADFAGRLVNAYALARPPADWSDLDGHGTHVAGSVLGNGSLSGSNPASQTYINSFAGVAPEAGLVFQSIDDGSGRLPGLPADLNDLFQQAYNDGARIHVNSWGGVDNLGAYTLDAQQADQFAWSHPDMTIFFAAGNEAVDKNRDGVIDPDAISWPGTAKNVVAVGASESFRPLGGFNYPNGVCWAWADCWPQDFPVLPIAIDALSNNVNGLAAFSGRGPTDDGRIKPDLVAPGTNIISARSHHPRAGTGWGFYNSHYIYDGGTSMATPLAAGAAVLVRDWYNDVRRIASPSGALIKATLINGATTLAPGQYGYGSTQEVPDSIPNNAVGWGRVNLAGSIAPDAPIALWFDDHSTGLSTGTSVVYRLNISPPSPGISLPGATDIIQNGGFETGNLSAWEPSGSPGVSGVQKRSGNYSVRLTNGDSQDHHVRQAISVPSNVVSATLSFWVRIDSS